MNNTNDLLASLGLEAVNPMVQEDGMRLLKPQDDPKIISYIPRIPGYDADPIIKYEVHYFERLHKKIRCHGGSCCIRAREIKEQLESMSEAERKGKIGANRQTRYLIPVLLYTGNMQAYGTPVELRYLDLAWGTYNEWIEGKDLIQATATPYFQRDFVLTKATKTGTNITTAKLTPLEGQAKWLQDPTVKAAVDKLLAQPDLFANLVKRVPAKLTEEEFVAQWEAAKPVQTVAEQAIMQSSINNTAYAQPVQIPQPAFVTPTLVPPQTVQVQAVQPAVQPVAQPVPQTVAQPVPPQTVQVQAVQPAVQPVAQPVPQTAATATEINLDDINDLDSILAGLPQD